MAAFYFPKANLFPKSPSDVSPQQLLPMATTKTSPPVPASKTHLILNNSNAGIELSRALLRVSGTCGLLHHFKSKHVVLSAKFTTRVGYVSQREIVRFLTFSLVEKSAQKYDVNSVSIVEYVHILKTNEASLP